MRSSPTGHISVAVHFPFTLVIRHTRPVFSALDIARSYSLDRKADMFITTETPDAAAPNRLFDLDGPLNFRDLGGYPVGRDRFVRTGLLAAFVLDLLGVDDDLIADDYALTAAIMPAFRQRIERRMANEPELRKRMEESGRTPEVLDEMLSARPSTIHLVLTKLRAEYGSVESWLLQNGLGTSAPEKLRNRLIG